MKEAISVDLSQIRLIVNSLSDGEFSTADVIRAYSGVFHANTNTPVHQSLNAQLGKLLKRNASELGITEVASSRGLDDDYGNRTSSSYWRKI